MPVVIFRMVTIGKDNKYLGFYCYISSTIVMFPSNLIFVTIQGTVMCVNLDLTHLCRVDSST